MVEGTPRRLPFGFAATAGVGRLVLGDHAAGALTIDHLELEVTDLGTDPGAAAAERFQRKRTRLRALAVRVTAAALERRVAESRRPLAGLGISQLVVRLHDGYVSVRARAADGLAAADLSFRVYIANAGGNLRALATTVRVLGHLPTPGPVIADRILSALLGASEAAGVIDLPRVRGLCDVEVDLVGALLWSLMPPAGWRLPAVTDLELTHVKIARTGVEIQYGPSGSRGGDLGVRASTLQLAAAHDLMHSADRNLRDGHLEDTMRGYRALLAAGGPDQPLLLERILALAAARPPWFHEGLELARQALGRWSTFPAANAALASITLAQGDAREAASHLTTLAQLASADGDDDQAALAALAGARLLRVLEPKAATTLYQLALEHDPASAEAADALADRYADEHRWPELVRLLRARAAVSDPARGVQLRLRLADVLVRHTHDAIGAQAELAAARDLAPDDPAVHEMTASILQSSDPAAAVAAWRSVARLGEQRGDHRTAARAFSILGGLLAELAAPGPDDAADAGAHSPPHDLGGEAEAAWRRALELDPLQADAITGLAAAAARRDEHTLAAELYERLRGVGLPQQVAARGELQLARSLVVLGRADDARGSLRRATLAGGETAAEAHAVLAEIAEASGDREHAVAELDTAIGSLVDLAASRPGSTRLMARAAELAALRATLLDKAAQPAQAIDEWQRAHELGAAHAPAIARDAARTLLARAGDDAHAERRWIDAVLATRPPPTERAELLVRRADVRRREPTPDAAAAIADLHEALALVGDADPSLVPLRRRAYHLEAELLANGGDPRARAQVFAALAKLAERAAERVEHETAAATAWLAADDPGAALPHGTRAHAELATETEVPSALRRHVLATLGEAAWRQRAWADVLRAYRGLLADEDADATRATLHRYRLAVAADRGGDARLAITTLAPLALHVPDGETAELHGQALRLYADLAERTGDLAAAAAALEGFAGLGADGNASARADAMYRAGELFRRAERGDDAVRCLEAALRLSDTHLPALDTLELHWREHGDLERVAVILGRKVAATARHPMRQKPLLSRLGDLQDQLGRPDVALETHRRALEIDPAWRPSLRYVTLQLRDQGAAVAAAGGLAQLTGELPGDHGDDPIAVGRDRAVAAQALADLVLRLDDPQLDAIREVARPALDHADAAEPTIARGLARLRGDAPAAVQAGPRSEEDTQSGRVAGGAAGALSLREAADRARRAGKTDEAFASLEAANHVNPGDAEVLRELVELATQVGDHAAAAKHCKALAALRRGARRGDALLELADLYYDKLDEPTRGRDAMRDAAEAFGSGARRDATLRMLASEAAAHLAWDVAAAALAAISADRRGKQDIGQLATALLRAGREREALTTLEEATATGRHDDGGALLGQIRGELARKADLAAALEMRADQALPEDARELRAEAVQLWHRIGRAPSIPPPLTSVPMPAPGPVGTGPIQIPTPSVIVRGTFAEQAIVLAAAAMGADRDRLIAAHEAHPEDPALLAALLAHLGEREPALRREVLERSARAPDGRGKAMALHELAQLARLHERDPIRAGALWTAAHRADTEYAPAWMPLADALAAADELDAARELYERVAVSDEYDEAARTWAAGRADALGFDSSVVSGEFHASPAAATTATATATATISSADAEPDLEPEGSSPSPSPLGRAAKKTDPAALQKARELAEEGDWAAALTVAERAASEADPEALQLLERLYLESGDITGASEAIGRQLLLVDAPEARAPLWRRRAKIYRDAMGRDAEAYRCLKEAHACSPADPEVAYQLRTAAMIRGEHALAASLLYREIAGSTNPRDRGALHLELALIYDERLSDAAQAQVNYEQALAFDPTIPAAKPPLARRYEALGRYADAARMYDDAAGTARPNDRGALYEAAIRCRAALAAAAPHPAHAPPASEADLAVRLERAEEAGDREAAVDVAHQLWRAEPGHPAAFRVLAAVHRAAGDLAELTDLTSAHVSHSGNPDERATAWLEVARLAEELGAQDQAARAYDHALIEAPGHIGALDARGALAFNLGDFATADLIYRDLGPGESILGDDELALRRSIVAEQLGRDDEALVHATTAAAAAPGRRDVLMRLQELATRTGEHQVALEAARTVLDLVPLDDDEAQLSTSFELVDLLRVTGDLDGAAAQLERVIRDHPQHAGALETLADIHMARGDWPAATRFLYQLVPLAPSPGERADRLYRLGEAVLVHLGDVDRADDVFLRASDLDPGHVPTLRRLLDVYWRADDPAALVEVASELSSAGALATEPVQHHALAHAMVAAALLGDARLASALAKALGPAAPASLAAALGELANRTGRLTLGSSATAVAELGRRGMVDLVALRAAAAGTQVAMALA